MLVISRASMVVNVTLIHSRSSDVSMYIHGQQGKQTKQTRRVLTYKALSISRFFGLFCHFIKMVVSILKVA